MRSNEYIIGYILITSLKDKNIINVCTK